MTRVVSMVMLIAAALSAPGVAQPQPVGKAFRVAYLTAASTRADAPLFDSFRQGMQELGYLEGRNIAYEIRRAEGTFERLPGQAAELVGLKPDIILVFTTPAALAAKNATRTIPIVMVGTGDPVGTGLVDSLARPGGNVTGSTNIIVEMAGKRLELLKQVVPRLSRVAVLGHPGDPTFAGQMRHVEVVARALKVDVLPVEIRAVNELGRAFDTIVKRRADGVLRPGDALSVLVRGLPGTLAVKHRLPTMASRSEEVEAGLLMSYGPNRFALFHQAAVYVDKILRGARPADLPVEQPTKFELVINLKTAKALGLTIPPAVLARADEVIQ
jgi:putative ABC transport system substrate-binding protein